MDIGQFIGFVSDGVIIDSQANKVEMGKSQYLINVRTGQEKFRKNVLKNFDGYCITGIKEKELLDACHIIPVRLNSKTSGHISNGLCFYNELHRLFDQGYFSFGDDFKVIPTKHLGKLSSQLQERISQLIGKPIKYLKKVEIDAKYIQEHRENILNSFMEKKVK